MAKAPLTAGFYKPKDITEKIPARKGQEFFGLLFLFFVFVVAVFIRRRIKQANYGSFYSVVFYFGDLY